MTWKEFKAMVDAYLAERGIDEDVSVWYIDVSFPGEYETYVAIEN